MARVKKFQYKIKGIGGKRDKKNGIKPIPLMKDDKCDHKLISFKPFSTYGGKYEWNSMGFQAVCSKCGKPINKSDILKCDLKTVDSPQKKSLK